MKITITPYNPKWIQQFSSLKNELSLILKELNPVIEHIGSTSVPGLAAKPVIDISVGIKDVKQFDRVVELMEPHPYIYYKVFNSTMPKRRLFVRLKKEADQKLFPKVFINPDHIPHDQINIYRMAHVHVWEFGTPDWVRHIAFREYLKAHPDVKQQYQDLKKKLSLKNWKHGMDYNDGKNSFIKEEEAKAIAWYNTNNIK